MKANLLSTNKTSPVRGSALGILIVLTALSIISWNWPYAGLILQPVRIFVTCVHELGHALTCIATGGWVSGLTIVPDNQGHGGVTMGHGGNPFIVTQAGYLGTAFFGCLLIFLGRTQIICRALLLLIGATMCLSSIFFMSGAVLNEWRIGEGLASMFWGLTIGGGLIWCGLKLKPLFAQWLLLFLAIQTSLNALTDVWILIEQSFGFGGTYSFSDATNMQSLTYIPAFIWSIIWGLVSLVMLFSTLWFCFSGNTRPE